MTDEELFQLIHRIATISFEYNSANLELGDRRNSWVNPYFYQTQSGVFLELSSGFPSSLWTPWGKWTCWSFSTSNGNPQIDEFLQRLGATQYRPLNTSGAFGPILALTRVDSVSLPPAVLRKQEDFLPGEQADAAWRQLVRLTKEVMP